MIDEELKLLITTPKISVVEAMEKIDKNSSGILFVIDSEERLIGSVTDGDIRRWIIRAGGLGETVDKYMNDAPKYLLDGDKDKAVSYMKDNHIGAVPILDQDHKIMAVVFADEKSKVKVRKSEKLRDTAVVIMAGGKGTRLYPYTKILPKPLIPIGDVPIIERIINKFCEYGISQYYLTLNYKKGMIRSYFSDLDPEYDIYYVEEEKPLGTAGSIKLINNKFRSPVIITNCDTLIDADYEDLMQYHISSGNVLTIVSALKNIIVPYGVMHSKEQGRITSIEEKPKMSYLVNTGLYVLDPKFIEKIPDDKVFHMTHLATLLIKDGYQVGMYPISEESFLDMGEFEEMKRMERELDLG